jgi:TatD DNase family protein
VKLVPIEQLVTETDSPYLSPVAGERNEPSNVTITVKKIAEIKGMDEEDVRRILLDNAKKLFKI